jgi:hypothetical protein
MRSAPEEFDMTVQAVESDSVKREVLEGIGMAAALVDLGDGALLIAIQRADGVARVVFSGLPREQALALARALAAP